MLATTGRICWCGHTDLNSVNHNPDTFLPALQAMAAELPVPAHFMPIGLTNGPDEGSDNPAEY